MPVAFVCRTRSSLPPQELFDLSRNIDAHVGSMTKSREKAIAGVTSGLISEGETVTWQAWHLGVRFRMTSRIVRMEAPASFTDEQVKGPFKAFKQRSITPKIVRGVPFCFRATIHSSKPRHGKKQFVNIHKRCVTILIRDSRVELRNVLNDSKTGKD